MAYNLIRSARNLARQRFRPSFAYVLDDNRSNLSRLNEEPKIQILGPSRSFGTRSLGFGEILQARTSLQGSVFARNMSTVSTAAVEAALSSPTVSEISLATADSCFPVAAVQHLIDAVHCFTGLNWWASIAVSTILVRAITIPFMMWHPFRDLWILFESSPAAAKLREKRFSHVIREYSDDHDGPFRATVIRWSVCLSFYYAIDNMVEKIPSFASGGDLWFTNLTTADSYLILPALSAFIYLRRTKLFMRPEDGKWTMSIQTRNTTYVTTQERNFLHDLAVIIPFFFPKAFFFYWIPSNMFMVIFRTAMVRRRPSTLYLRE